MFSAIPDSEKLTLKNNHWMPFHLCFSPHPNTVGFSRNSQYTKPLHHGQNALHRPKAYAPIYEQEVSNLMRIWAKKVKQQLFEV